MRHRLIVPALLLAASFASGERQFKTLKEAQEAVLGARADAIKRLE
jgi:hypothetical protein